MNEEDVVVLEVNKKNVKHELAKLLVGTAAGFIATKVAENVYEHLTSRRQNTTADPEQ